MVSFKIGSPIVATLVFVTMATAAAPPKYHSRQVEILLQQLDDDEFQQRLDADNQLRAMGKPIVSVLRIEQQRTTSPEVRHRLSEMIRDLTIDERLGHLLQMLTARDAKQRASADYALRQAGSAVVPHLMEQVRSETDVVRRRQLEKLITELSPSRR